MVFLALTLTACVAIAQKPQAAPAFTWQTVTPESVGYSSGRLDALRQWLKTQQTQSMMVLYKGKVIFTYGDVAKPTKIASIRKSVLAMLMGKYVVSGQLDMGKTVEELGLKDNSPFLDLEKRATLEQLMSGRSGIYMEEPGDWLGAQEPRRGFVAPGQSFYYDNWEFDAAGVAFEKVTGQNIYDALEHDLAQPLGMQDFRRELQKKIPSTNSDFPEYAMYLSARDMARLGLLMEQGGMWNGKPLMSGDWIRYSTGIITPWDEMNPPILRLRGMPERWGFGSGWWVWDAQTYAGAQSPGPFQGAFEARGSGGQYITVIPSRDLVIVHKVDLGEHPKSSEWTMDPESWDAITNMVIASTCNGKCPDVDHSAH